MFAIPRFVASIRVRRLWLRLQSLVVVCVGSAALADAACAQSTTGGPAAGGDKSYGIPWLVVVLVVALGLFITLRPAGRATDIKRDSQMEL